MPDVTTTTTSTKSTSTSSISLEAILEGGSMPSRKTLAELPRKVVHFILATNADPEIRKVMALNGFSQKEVDEPWRLLQQLGSVGPTDVPNDVAEAIAQIARWYTPNLAKVDATLRHYHPAQAAFVLKELDPASGYQAVLAAATLVDRLEALESDPTRKETHDADLAALALLSERGVSKSERTRVRGLIKIALSVSPVVDMPTEDPATMTSEREKILLQLFAWYRDWTKMAKVFVKRREWLIHIGLGRRQTRRAKKTDTGVTTTTTPVAGPPAGTTTTPTGPSTPVAVPTPVVTFPPVTVPMASAGGAPS